jgi:hypothetical protein
MQPSLFNNDIISYKSCTYKGETYHVREDGSIYRLRNPKKNKRKLDEVWSFGKPIEKGYLHFSGILVHQIVATAYHGTAPSDKHIVDHIDTTIQNNRPENLRWVTRLENIIDNPISKARIIKKCGSIEAFLENPEKFKDRFNEPNIAWMKTVSKEEAQETLERLLKRATNTEHHSITSKGFYPNGYPTNHLIEENKSRRAININALQINWKTPSTFPCTPDPTVSSDLWSYFLNLSKDTLFCENQIYQSRVWKFIYCTEKQALFVITKKELGTGAAIKPWGLAKITYENYLFVHESLGTFFKEESAEKEFILAQGLVWEGGETFDDLIK